MKSVALMCCRNSDWVLGLSARVALMWCDALVILLHNCTDGTRAMALELDIEYPGRIIIPVVNSQDWDEMAHRQFMLERARHMGATHIVMIDDDEILTGNLLDTARQFTERPKGNSILRLPGYNLRGGINRYHSNGIWANRWFSVAFADDPRLHWVGDRFHQREPLGLSMNAWQPVRQGDGGIMHLWGASERRLRAKHAWYRVTERLRWPDKPVAEIEQTYRPATEGDWRAPAAKWTYADVPESWWAPYAHLMRYLDLDAEPWQESEVRRLVAEHGRGLFAGLDLLGVA